MTVRCWILAVLPSLLIACSGKGSVPAAAGIQTDASPATLHDGSNLYVASGGGRERNPPPAGGVTVYGLQRGKKLQTIQNGVDHPSAVAFDASGELYVANEEPQEGSYYSGSVSVFAVGGYAPIRILYDTGNPDALAFDRFGNVYVANKYYYGKGFYCSIGSVGVYAPGGTAPMRIIGRNGTVVEPQALAFDDAGNLYVANGIVTYGSCHAGNSVTVFPAGVSLPKATISNGVDWPKALTFGTGVLYVANAPPHGAKRLPLGSVTVYQLGSYALLRTITKGIHTPDSMALDSSGNLYVANLYGRSITVYAPGSSVPSRTISQGVTSPKTILFGAEGDLYVANVYQNTISVYAPGSNSPRLTIDVPIADPISLALSP